MAPMVIRLLGAVVPFLPSTELGTIKGAVTTPPTTAAFFKNARRFISVCSLITYGFLFVVYLNAIYPTHLVGQQWSHCSKQNGLPQLPQRFEGYNSMV
jgi:hypothetical protein